jgi:hypothetical protein
VEAEDKQRQIDVMTALEKSMTKELADTKKHLAAAQEQVSDFASKCTVLTEQSSKEVSSNTSMSSPPPRMPSVQPSPITPLTNTPTQLSNYSTEAKLRKELQKASEIIYSMKNEAQSLRRRFDLAQLTSQTQTSRAEDFRLQNMQLRAQLDMNNRANLASKSNQNQEYEFYKAKCESLTTELKKMKLKLEGAGRGDDAGMSLEEVPETVDEEMVEEGTEIVMEEIVVMTEESTQIVEEFTEEVEDSAEDGLGFDE